MFVCFFSILYISGWLNLYSWRLYDLFDLIRTYKLHIWEYKNLGKWSSRCNPVNSESIARVNKLIRIEVFRYIIRLIILWKEKIWYQQNLPFVWHSLFHWIFYQNFQSLFHSFFKNYILFWDLKKMIHSKKEYL